MMAAHSIFWRIFYSLLFFAAFLALSTGSLFLWISDRLGAFIVEEQVKPAMNALVAAEKQARMLRDRGKPGLDSSAIAEKIGARFYVGRQVPKDWANFADGLHFINGKSGFVYITRDNGIIYALTGASRAYNSFLSQTAWLILATCAAALMAAFLTAWLIAHAIARPLLRLAGCIRKSHSGVAQIPENLLRRQDETGTLARAIAGHQAEAREFLERETAFTGDVSHELRTPLTIMRGCVELLEAGTKDRESLKILARMNRTAKKMEETVNALLLLARKAATPITGFDIAALLKDALQDFCGADFAKELARGKSASQTSAGVELHLEILDKPFVTGQRELVATLLKIILENALLYSADKKVSILLCDKYLRIANKAHIEGLDCEQCDLTQSSSNRGGIGLSIARRICARTGWKMDIVASQAAGEVVCGIWFASLEADADIENV